MIMRYYIQCSTWVQVSCQLTKDLVDGGVGRQRAVEDAEVPLEPLGDVVAAAARVAHGRQELHVHDVGELPGLLQVVEAPLLHQLPHYLVGDLQTWGGCYGTTHNTIINIIKKYILKLHYVRFLTGGL